MNGFKAGLPKFHNVRDVDTPSRRPQNWNAMSRPEVTDLKEEWRNDVSQISKRSFYITSLGILSIKFLDAQPMSASSPRGIPFQINNPDAIYPILWVLWVYLFVRILVVLIRHYKSLQSQWRRRIRENLFEKENGYSDYLRNKLLSRLKDLDPGEISRVTHTSGIWIIRTNFHSSEGKAEKVKIFIWTAPRFILPIHKEMVKMIFIEEIAQDYLFISLISVVTIILGGLSFWDGSWICLLSECSEAIWPF